MGTDISFDGNVNVSYKGNDYIVKVKAKANYYYDSGRMYMPNGDPGYPPEEDFEVTDFEIYSVMDSYENTIEGFDVTEDFKDCVLDELYEVNWDEWEFPEEEEPDYDWEEF